MCGIAGFTSRLDEAACGSVLTSMTQALAHRGPDGSGAFVTHMRDGRCVALGHRRLSIIDLGTGEQPMHLADSRYTIVFNGEIYNYVELREELKALGCRFQTTSDTEVLLQAWASWGAEALPKLRGMFAFALWDRKTQELILARDPFGKKPLFYFEAGGELVFASEFTGLVCHPNFDNQVDPKALARFLIWKYVPGAETLVKAVREIPAGHYGIWSNGRLTLSRYYTVPDQVTDPGRQMPMTADTVAAFRAELSEAVSIRLRSDVPLGAFLSGGIDSSAIVSLMAQITGKPVKTFSVGFHEDEYSELWAARLIAKRYNTDHHEIKISPDAFLGDLEAVTWQRGAPLSEMADVPVYALSKLAAEHVKVVLSGEGADELLGGYPKHRGEVFVNRAHAFTPPLFDKAAGALGERLPYRYRRLAILARVAQERDFVNRQGAWFGLMNAATAGQLCPDLFADYTPFIWPEDPGEAAGSLARSLKFDKTVWLPGTLLERGDRMTMAASIEGRMPFMDTKLTNFVTRLPPQAFLSNGRGKAILRQAMKADIPSEILTKPKAGFRVPIHDWLRGSLRDYAHDRLFGRDSALADFIDQPRLKTLWDQHQAQTSNREKELWSLMTLEIFLRQLAEAGVARAAA